VEEALMNAITHAYEPGSPGPVTLTAQLDGPQLRINVRDRGIPFDDSLEPVYPSNTSGSGLQRIRAMADKVVWNCLGPQGKELHLEFDLGFKMDHTLSVPREKSHPKIIENDDAAPPASHTYTIRRFRPEDGIGVARCAYGAYGYSYPSSDLYTPRRLAELNENGFFISMVALSDQTGEVVGHCSVQRYYIGGTVEVGQAVVNPSHRGASLAGLIFKGLVQEAIKEGVCSLVDHEVSSHPASQILANRAGFSPCALALGAMPASLDFKSLSGAVSQRESCVVSMKLLTRPDPSVLCAPSHHQKMLETIYSAMDKPVTFKPAPSSPGPAKVTIQMNRGWNIADIQVKCIGHNALAAIRRCLQDLLEIGQVDVVYLELPLDQGDTTDLCRSVEGDGFFFTGLGPSSVTVGGESLFLQYLNTQLDLSLLQIATPMGRTIFDYVAQERRRLMKSSVK
jgi:L-amino acid N-acyltransferase YncA